MARLGPPMRWLDPSGLTCSVILWKVADIRSSGVQVIRLAPVIGKIGWQACCAPIGVGYSNCFQVLETEDGREAGGHRNLDLAEVFLDIRHKHNQLHP